jgi:hypothetical protein
MSLVDQIKAEAKKAGTNKGKFIYFKPGTKVRIRFLNDMEDGMKVTFHDSFAEGINVPCQELFGRECPHCEVDSLRTRDQFIWSAWDHEAKEVKLLMGAVNNASPIPSLVGMYETYGTMVDRDYVLTKNGSGTQTTFTVVPMDKAKFRNEKAKPFSESQILKMLDKAFPDDSSVDGDDEDDAPKKKKKSPAPPIKKGKAKPAEEDWDDTEDEEDDAPDYSAMTPKELFVICKDKGLDPEPKQPKAYYIGLLDDVDEDGDEDDDW